ncbi:MAG: flagellar type III secretion system pore protein FliP [Thioalkalispiraceae bacterium]|jgi:flagellar biosynthetic protein FliP
MMSVKKASVLSLFSILLFIIPLSGFAQEGFPALTVTKEAGSETYSLSIQVLILMTLLTLLPAAVMMMTSFTRIIIVLAILRQAIGLVQTPSSQTLIGLALFLTFFIMAPVIDKINNIALQPYMAEKIDLETAVKKAGEPLRAFMLGQTRNTDLSMFADIAGIENPKDVSGIPFRVLVPAFVTSELKTAFQIGFLLFIPFLIIDLVVASVLMSMGMMMLSPMIISLPFKIMLFVLVDGWNIIMGTLASSFFT